jgi:hypothetical protein
MEVVLGASDFDAEQAERYGWINRSLPDAELDAFVAQRGRAPRRRRTVPATGPFGRGHGPHGNPVRPGPAACSPLEPDLGDRIGSL